MAYGLAGDQPDRALAIARAIEDPWFRCQALSQVARYWPGAKYDHLLDEAVKAADSQDDAYKQVAVSAWPIRAYLELGNSPPAQKLLQRYTRASDAIENMGSRSEALFLLFQASRPFGSGLWLPVFWALVNAAEPVLAWRQQRNLRDAVGIVASEHPELVQDVLDKLSNNASVLAIRRYLARLPEGSAKPRPFFWLADAAHRI